MTRKDFELIAAALHTAKPRAVWEMTETAEVSRSLKDQLHAWHHVCYSMASALAGTNPRFDRERFLKACEGED